MLAARTSEAALVDTNILVYRFDPRNRIKQQIAHDVLRQRLGGDQALAVPHQAIVEFVAAVARPQPDLGGVPLLARDEALIEAESIMAQFRILYPGPELLRTALRGAAAYKLSWFDAHLWAYAEVFGLPEILSEDFEHGRHYGSVRVADPFRVATGDVQELPPLYA